MDIEGMSIEQMNRQEFYQAVTILTDSREQENRHILSALEGLGIRHEQRKLDIGDYSFCVDGRDFSTAFAVERKSGAEEIYSNLTETPQGQSLNRLEKELDAGSRLLNQFTMVIEGVGSMDELRSYVVPDWKMRAMPRRVKADIGGTCYAALRAWQAANRYNFRIEFVPHKEDVVALLLEEAYIYYHNYKKLIAPRRQERRAVPEG